MKHILMIIGSLLLIAFGLRVFGFLSAFVTTDRGFFSLLFGGIVVCMSGFWLESYQQKPTNVYQERHRKSQMASCRNAICLSMLVLLFIVASYI